MHHSRLGSTPIESRTPASTKLTPPRFDDPFRIKHLKFPTGMKKQIDREKLIKKLETLGQKHITQGFGDEFKCTTLRVLKDDEIMEGENLTTIIWIDR